MTSDLSCVGHAAVVGLEQTGSVEPPGVPPQRNIGASLI